LRSRGSSRLDRVTFINQLGGVYAGKTNGNDIQQYTLPLLQELEIPEPPPGLGRATAKMAIAVAKKRASLENMVKMRVGWVVVVVN
jgi:hypothetical protein